MVWIDAICIDQENPEERGRQVQLMAKIYSNALCVIVWLGEDVEGTNGALEDIRRAANEELIEPSRKEMSLQAILRLLQRPWFQRIWVSNKCLAIVTR